MRHCDIYFKESDLIIYISIATFFHRKCQGFSEVMSTLSYVYHFCHPYASRAYARSSAAETERRQAFRDEIVGQLPFDLIGMNETLPSVKISISAGQEDSDSHWTLERHDISGLYTLMRCHV